MRKLTFFTLICLFALSGVCIAQNFNYSGMGRDSGMMPSGKWWRMPAIEQKLGLTAEEQEKLDKLFVENRRKLIDLKGNVEKEVLNLDMILEQKDIDESGCMGQFKKLQDARSDLSIERFRFVVEVRKLLGHDRFQKLKTNYDRRMTRMRGKQGRQKSMKEKVGKEEKSAKEDMPKD